MDKWDSVATEDDLACCAARGLPKHTKLRDKKKAAAILDWLNFRMGRAIEPLLRISRPKTK